MLPYIRMIYYWSQSDQYTLTQTHVLVVLTEGMQSIIGFHMGRLNRVWVTYLIAGSLESAN